MIYTHHLAVPFRELVVDANKSETAPGGSPALDDNLIMHGDNLEALKALLPMYAGRWTASTSIHPTTPATRAGATTTRSTTRSCAGSSRSRPTQWTRKISNGTTSGFARCGPRLQLLRELLAENGAIFVSIDDNEVHRARELMDELFGPENFIDCIIWQKNYSPKGTSKYFSSNHDYIW